MSHQLTNQANLELNTAVVDSDFSAADGILNKTGAGAYEAIPSRWNETAAPNAATDDITLGFVPGSRWIDTTNDEEYVCLDNTDGAAVWVQTTGGAGGGDVSKVGTPVDSQLGVWTGDGTIEGHTSLTFDRSDFIITDAVNDGNPTFQMGSAAAEQLSIQAIYDSGLQTLDRVDFTTKAASATADKGLFRFSVDEVAVLDIDDGGLDLTGSIDLSGSINSAAGLEQLTFIADASAVNQIEIEHEAAGSSPIIRGTGDDTNVGIVFQGKGISVFDFEGGIVMPIRTETGATYNIALSDYVILSDATTQAQTVSLPAIPQAGTTFIVKKIDADVNTSDVDTADAALIDGAASLSIFDNDSATFVSDGTNWHLV
jgi:hypothetical protein